MMNIIIDNIGFSLQKMGGLSVVWGVLLNALKRSGLQYKCMEYPGCENNQVRKYIQNLNIELHSPWRMQIERYLDVSILENQPFIFHSSHYRICKNSKAVNITTVHDFTYERYRKGLPKWVHSWQKFKAIRKADVVVCISESAKQDVMHYLPDVPESKIRVIHNGVSTDYKPVVCSSYKSFGDYIVFVGSRQPYKKFDFLVECLKGTKYKLAIVGGALNESEIAFLNKKLGKEKYQPMGYLTNEELNELYNQAVCLAYPSVYEGFGIPILEAQRAGCPVIAFNASSIPEVIGNTPLLLNDLSVDEFLSKLEMLEDKNIRKSIIDSGFVNSKRFSWEKMGYEYIGLYKELIAKYSIK